MSSTSSKTSTYTRDPDLVVWEVHGTVRLEDVRELFAVITQFTTDKAGYFLLVLIGSYDGIDSDARKLIVETPKRSDGRPIRTFGTATVGASFHVRIAGTMVAKAAMALSGGAVPQMCFVETEAQAMEWLATQRQLTAGI